MSLSRLAGLLSACVISFASTSTYAQSPSSDDRCLELLGTSPSLYGLCVAFWETSKIPIGSNVPPANSAILERYNEKKGEDGPDMPGLDAECPCYFGYNVNEIAADLSSECSFHGNDVNETQWYRIGTETHFAQSGLNVADSPSYILGCRYGDGSGDQTVIFFTPENGFDTIEKQLGTLANCMNLIATPCGYPMLEPQF